MKKLICLILLTTAILAKGQDPGGWQKAKWGMTESQIAKAFSGELPTRTHIGHRDYLITFEYSSAGKLHRVILAADTKGGNRVLYNDVFEMMMEKYGKPESGDRASSPSRGYALWSFRNTKIIMTLRNNDNVKDSFTDPLDFFTIEYRSSKYAEPAAENL